MYFRIKKVGKRRYLQIVESAWDGARSRQKVVASLGRVDAEDGPDRLSKLLMSGDRLTKGVLVFGEDDNRPSGTRRLAIHRFGPRAVFEHMWHDVGLERHVREILDEAGELASGGAPDASKAGDAILQSAIWRVFGLGSAPSPRLTDSLGVEGRSQAEVFEALGRWGRAIRGGESVREMRCGHTSAHEDIAWPIITLLGVSRAPSTAGAPPIPTITGFAVDTRGRMLGWEVAARAPGASLSDAARDAAERLVDLTRARCGDVRPLVQASATLLPDTHAASLRALGAETMTYGALKADDEATVTGWTPWRYRAFGAGRWGTISADGATTALAITRDGTGARRGASWRVTTSIDAPDAALVTRFLEHDQYQRYLVKNQAACWEPGVAACEQIDLALGDAAADAIGVALALELYHRATEDAPERPSHEEIIGHVMAAQRILARDGDDVSIVHHEMPPASEETLRSIGVVTDPEG